METLLFYSCFEIISLFLMYIAQRYKKENTEKNRGFVLKKSTFFLSLSIIPLIVLVGFRDINVGTDTASYVETFFRIVNGSIRESDKIWLSEGFIVICNIIGWFDKNSYVMYNLTIGFLTMFFIYKAIWENSKKPTLSLFIFLATCLFFQTFNQSRQMLAIAIVLYSCKYIRTNDFKKYLIFILLATSIHKSAIIMLPFYFLCKVKINKTTLYRYAIIIVASLAMFQFLSNILLLTNYGIVYNDKGFFISTSSSYMNLAIRLFLLFNCLFYARYMKENINNCDFEKKLFNLCIWCIVFQVITTQIYVFARITTYFYVMFVILIPNIYSMIENKNTRRIFLLENIGIFVLYYIVYFNSVASSSGYDVYNFFS